MPQFWDVSNLPEGPEKDKIRCLILHLEIQPNVSEIGLAVERTRDHFYYTLEWAKVQGVDCGPLLADLIRKLRALIDLSEKLQHEAAAKPPALEPSVSLGTEAKKCMAEVMRVWLRNNWINPYPDDGILRDLAKECGVSKAMIGTWLINARSRKWRPAIMQAYDLGRPAETLLEDSIRIYDNEPLRALCEEDNSRKRTREL